MAEKIKYASTTVCRETGIDRLCTFKVSREPKTKRTKGGDMIIEGLANAAVPDRIGDVIKGEAWELDNFKKNPIIFFNHDRDIPIGKAVDFKAGPEGLRMKVRISKSNNGPVPYLRDMIDEGILKTFSVGFDPHDSETKDNETGHNNIGRAELLETSVVTLPMNQESLFDVKSGQKSVGRNPFKKLDIASWKSKSYANAVHDVLELKGAYAAGMLQVRIQRMSDSMGLSKADILKRIADKSDASLETINGVMVGDVLPIPEELLKAFCEVLMLEFEDVQSLNSKLFGDEEKPDEDEDDEDDEDKDEDEKQTDDEMDDDDEDEESDDDEEKSEEKDDMQECVERKLPKLLDEGMERDQALARAISMCRQETGKSCELSAEQLQGFLNLADEKQADQGEDVPTETVAINDNKNDPTDFGNPHLDVAKSHLALTGNIATLLKELLDEFRDVNSKMTQVLDGKSAESEPPQGDDAESIEESDSDEVRQLQARLESQKQIFDNFKKRLRDIRVND